MCSWQINDEMIKAIALAAGPPAHLLQADDSGAAGIIRTST